MIVGNIDAANRGKTVSQLSFKEEGTYEEGQLNRLMDIMNHQMVNALNLELAVNKSSIRIEKLEHAIDLDTCKISTTMTVCDADMLPIYIVNKDGISEGPI